MSTFSGFPTVIFNLSVRIYIQKITQKPHSHILRFLPLTNFNLNSTQAAFASNKTSLNEKFTAIIKHFATIEVAIKLNLYA